MKLEEAIRQLVSESSIPFNPDLRSPWLDVGFEAGFVTGAEYILKQLEDLIIKQDSEEEEE